MQSSPPRSRLAPRPDHAIMDCLPLKDFVLDSLLFTDNLDYLE